MEGNGVLGLLREERYKWERRAPLTPAHCARLLRQRTVEHGQNEAVSKIIVQPCTKRVHTDMQYQEVGCEISEDLSDCGLIIGVKQPPVKSLLQNRAYAFFSHTHKAQLDNMPLLDEVLSKGVTLYDYELIVGEDGRRVVAFGEYAGRAGMIDFLRGLGERYLSLGHSTPLLSLGSAYMYISLSAAKAAVLAVGDEIAAVGLPAAICPLIFVFTGTGKVSKGAQEIFRLLPHQFVEPGELPVLLEYTESSVAGNRSTMSAKYGRPTFQVYGCVVAPQHMVTPVHHDAAFNKADYYAHPELYRPIFHETIAPYASVIVNCMYWERRYPRLLSNAQLRDLANDAQTRGRSMRLLGVADITCDVGGSVECMDRHTYIERPFFRYNPGPGSYHTDMDGPGVIFLAVDILPTELAREATKHFGDALSPFLPSLVHAKSMANTPAALQRACIARDGQLAPLYEYIHRMRVADHALSKGASVQKRHGNGSCHNFTTLVSLDGHLFDQFLINEALDVIETAGGSFHLASCRLGQNSDATSYAEVEVSAESAEALASILETLAAIANHEATAEYDGSESSSYSKHLKVRRKPSRELGSRPRLIVGSPPLLSRSFLSGPPVKRTSQSESTVQAAEVGALGPKEGDDNGQWRGCQTEAESEGERGSTAADGRARVEDQMPRVLILGAGRMCEPLIQHLARHGTGDWDSGGSGEVQNGERILDSHGTGEVSGAGSAERTSGKGARGAGASAGLSGEVSSRKLTSGGLHSVENVTSGVCEGDTLGDGLPVLMVRLTVASLLLEEAIKVIAGIPNCIAEQLDTRDGQRLHQLVAQADVVVSMLPAACHVAVAEACIQHKKHLVTASYVSDQMAALHLRAQAAGVVLLCEMGLDPGIDHMSAMKMIDSIHRRGGHVRTFVSMCGGLPAPAAATNPLGYKFSWSPRGAITAGRNPALYKQDGEMVSVDGPSLFASAAPVRLPHLPAFALERLPNRDSTTYGNLYGIAGEAQTVFRATLRYEGFSTTMDSIANLGFFDADPHPLLLSGELNTPNYDAESVNPGTKTALPCSDSHTLEEPQPPSARIEISIKQEDSSSRRSGPSELFTDLNPQIHNPHQVCASGEPPKRPSFMQFLLALVNGDDIKPAQNKDKTDQGTYDPAQNKYETFRDNVKHRERESNPSQAVSRKLLKLSGPAGRPNHIEAVAACLECLRFLGLTSNDEVPAGCKSPLDVLCHRMEERLAFLPGEQDMVLLHHEVEAVFPGEQTERHLATLLAFGSNRECPNGPVTAMARTVGLPAAIGAQLLLSGKIRARGVVRPLAAEVYEPALKALSRHGVRCEDRVECNTYGIDVHTE